MKVKLKLTGWGLLQAAILAVAGIMLLLNTDGGINRTVAIFLVAVNVLAVIKVVHNWYLLIIYGIIFYSNYSICISNYITNAVDNYFMGYRNTSIGTSGLNILLAFSILLLLIAPRTQKTTKQLSILRNNKYNPVFVFILYFLLAYIWVFGYHRPEVAGERGSPTSWYEYSVILIIVAYYFSGKNIFLLAGNILAALAFALQNFIYGGRITGIQVIIATFLCLFIDKLSLRTTLPAGAAFFVLMSGIGKLRGRILLLGFNFKAIVSALFSEYFALDTAYSSYFTSMTFLDQLTKTSFAHRMELFRSWVVSIFLGGRVENSNLSEYTRQYYVHYYGGILPYYFWFYLGAVGIILLVLYMRFLLRKIDASNSETSGLSQCIAVYLCSTTFRWYLYSPSQLLRGLMWLCIVYAGANLFDSIRGRSSDVRIEPT